MCLLGMDVGGAQMRLLWCHFQDFLHNLCHCQMVDSYLVCLVCVFLLLHSFRITSVGGQNVIKV